MVGGVFAGFGRMGARQRRAIGEMEIGEIGPEDFFILEDLLGHRSGPVGDDETVFTPLDLQFIAPRRVRGQEREEEERNP